MKICSECVLPETYPGIEFDERGVCNICRAYKEKEEHTLKEESFANEQELIACLEKYKNHKNRYDVLVPISGGVDSCNVLITIVEKYGLKALGFHNDQGYEDEIATANARNLCKALNVDLVIKQQDIGFMRKLYKYINETHVKGMNSCYICGNILYINALETADQYNIPLVINGYSKGQAAQIRSQDKAIEMLEKLLEIFRETADKEFVNQFLEKYNILNKRITYQDREDLEREVDCNKMLFIPFYVFDFNKIDKDLLREKIKAHFDWKPQKTSYPKRTTNCEMIWLNTYMDLQKMGYSNYHVEYAELVRKGEFTREQALKDLEFNPPPGVVERLAKQVDVDISKFKKGEPEQQEKNKSDDKKEQIEIEFGF
ncbi:MAG: hypothetical protein JSV88_16860 [Candidatus Aminicenantes bacterium]|nr:MAG: hypothetical protein JSV88_16860 [Candidatus Aminicenantes bacterium]